MLNTYIIINCVVFALISIDLIFITKFGKNTFKLIKTLICLPAIITVAIICAIYLFGIKGYSFEEGKQFIRDRLQFDERKSI